MNKKGGGVIHNTTVDLVEMKLFSGGLRNVRKHEWRNMHKNIHSVRDLHDNMYYERGFITHSRNPHNQQLNFHFGYGGFYKYYLQRYWINYLYKKLVRPLWPAALFYFFFGWAGMRAYDNAVYDYFYFFDAKTEVKH